MKSPSDAEVCAWAARQLGTAVRSCHPLAAGLGLRRFLRLQLAGAPGSVIARVEAGEDPRGRAAGTAPEPPLEPVRRFLERAGLPVPRSFGHDAGRGIDLLEDLGDRFLADAAAPAPREERLTLYRRAVALVPRLQRLEDPGGLPAFQRRLDAESFDYKARLFASHSLPFALSRPANPAETDRVRAAFAWIAARTEEAPLRLAHRDLQARNLLLPPGGEPPGQPVMIDLQGALLAPPEYDLVCLLRDSYHELEDADLDALLAEVRSELPDAPAPGLFRLRFDLLTLTRKAKDHARFCDLAHRRGRRELRRYLPATARSLRAAARRVAGADPSLAPLTELIAALSDRGDPPCGP